MYTIEFQAMIKNGTIEIPEEYIDMLQDKVHVIVQAEENGDNQQDLIDQLLETPLECGDFQPLNREQLYEHE